MPNDEVTEEQEASDAEKLDAVHQVNQIWSQAAALPPGEQREKYLRTANKLADLVGKAYKLEMPGEGLTADIGRAALKIPNYASGLLQAAPLAALEAAAGPKGKAVEVLKNAAYPNRLNTTTGEVFKDIGMPQLGQVSDVVPGFKEPGTADKWYQPEKGGALDWTGRGTIANVSDFLGSPANIKALLARSAAKKAGSMTATELQNLARDAEELSRNRSWLNRTARTAGNIAIDPLGYAQEGAGKALYKSAFGPADRAAVAGNAQPVSNVLYAHNVWGSPSSISNQANDLRARLGSKVSSAVSEVGEEIFPGVPRAELTARAEHMLNKELAAGGTNEASEAAIATLHKPINERFGVPGAPGVPDELNIVEAQELKQKMQRMAHAQRAYEGAPPNPSVSQTAGESREAARQMGHAYKQVGTDARRAVENLADEYQPGLGGQIYRMNSEKASLIEAKDALAKLAAQSPSSTLYHHLPYMVAGGGMGMMHHYDPYSLAAGIAAGGIVSSPTFRTGAGLVLGKTAPWASNAARVGLSQKYNPWFHEHKPFSEEEK